MVPVKYTMCFLHQGSRGEHVSLADTGDTVFVTNIRSLLNDITLTVFLYIYL